MRLLLDTHAFVWAASQPGRLPEQLRRDLADSANEVLLSAASVWEIAIKRRLGKIVFAPVTERRLSTLRLGSLPIGLDHAEEAGELPDLHRDPFDRMLVAQARVEGLTIATRDPQVRAYDVQTRWD